MSRSGVTAAGLCGLTSLAGSLRVLLMRGGAVSYFFFCFQGFRWWWFSGVCFISTFMRCNMVRNGLVGGGEEGQEGVCR